MRFISSGYALNLSKANSSGRLAQLGERLPYKEDVGGSIPSTPTSKQTVDLDGNINLPFLEMIKVQGMTRTELQTHLNNNYAKYLKNDTPLVYIEVRPIYCNFSL